MPDLGTLTDEFAALLAGDEELIADPYPLYERLRTNAPVLVAKDGDIAVITRHQDVNEAYRNGRRFLPVLERVVGFGDHLARLSAEEIALFREIEAFERLFISRQRGEDHRRYRGAMHRAFTPRRIAELRTTVEALVDDALERLEGEDAPDWMDLAYRVPLMVIMRLLGAPAEDAHRIKHWGDAVLDTMKLIPLDPIAVRDGHRRLEEYRAYAAELVERQRAGSGRSDLVTLLLDAEEEHRLAVEEVTATSLHLLFAGHETTANLIGNSVFLLLSHREQWAKLCADPSLASGAVEEALRFESPVQMLQRVTAADDEMYGVELAAGTSIVMVMGAANRDPQVFDDPSSFDIIRRPGDHLAFGKGLHFCLGASLARLEAEVALQATARRFPGLQLAVDPREVRWVQAAKLRGLASLAVRFG